MIVILVQTESNPFLLHNFGTKFVFLIRQSLSDGIHMLFYCSGFALSLWKRWPIENFSCQKTFSGLIPPIFQNPWGYLNKISKTKTMPFFNTLYHVSKTMLVCKFGAWPQSVFEAVAEATLAWSLWIFQDMWVRYKSWFGI